MPLTAALLVAAAAALPAQLAPPRPFPSVQACELEREAVAPGIERAGYRLLTAAGPLRVTIVIADPANPAVRFDTVLAHDTVGGGLETVSSMALRTGAVAGINGDYYAGGADGAPIGLVVRNGRIVHGAGGHPAFGISRRSVTVGVFDAGAGGVITAIGGGPVLLRDGRAAPDDGPAAVDRAMRIPASVLARFPSERVGLIAIDGRSPARSIGVNRAELIALLRALGVTDALLLDSGGSTALVARVLGEPQAALANVPSDGAERPVADGLFVYSDAPLGPPAALVVRPARITALRGARVALSARVVDAAGHALGDAHGLWRLAGDSAASIDATGTLHVGSRIAATTLHVERDGLAADVPLRVVARVARLAIGPAHANPSPGQLFGLTLDAWDAGGTPVLVGGLARWTASNARIDATGRLDSGHRDALVTASLGGMQTSARIPVGRHEVAFAPAGARAPGGWRFVSAPPGGPGHLDLLPGGLTIHYDFSHGGRAAYARAQRARGTAVPLTIACDVRGDGNGEALRLSFSDRYGARETVTLAPAVDFAGIRRVAAHGPLGLAPPVMLRDVYVTGGLAMPAVRAAGALRVGGCSATFAGTP